jgi:hypothetical protein
MVNASYATTNATGFGGRLMMNKSLRGDRRESSSKADYGFRRVRRNSHAGILPYVFGTSARRQCGQKKEPPFPAAFEVDNREASNRVDRSHSVSKPGQCSHKRESLMNCKESVFFKFR